MKRKASQTDRPAKKAKTGPKAVIQHAGGGQVRQGFGAVARSPGAAVIGEMKYFDSNLTNTNMTASDGSWPAGTIVDPTGTINLGSASVATPLCLFAPTVGAALNQRIGRKVKVLKIKIQGTIQTPVQAAQAAADAATSVRIVLVMDQQTNAAQMTGAQLFQTADSATAGLSTFQNPNNFGRFRVLKQKRLTLQNPNMTGSPTTADVVQGSLKVNWKMNVVFSQPITVNFNATNGGTVADVIDNSFHVLCACDSTALTPAINYYCRVCYKE